VAGKRKDASRIEGEGLLSGGKDFTKAKKAAFSKKRGPKTAETSRFAGGSPSRGKKNRSLYEEKARGRAHSGNQIGAQKVCLLLGGEKGGGSGAKKGRSKTKEVFRLKRTN